MAEETTRLLQPALEIGRSSAPLLAASIQESFSRWMRGPKPPRDVVREIYRSVLKPVSVEPRTDAERGDTELLELHHPSATPAELQQLTVAIRSAIRAGIQPQLIAKGSSGSYFARGVVDGGLRCVAVFKPSTEEPYGIHNPKWGKWLQRRLFGWFAWGRSCLLPGHS